MSKGNRNFAKPVDEHAEVLTETVEEVVTSSVEESYVEEATIPEPKTIITGFVTGPYKLNVRKEPSIDSDVVSVIDSGATVTVVDESNDTWLKVRTEAGNEGYCMKQYITVKS